MPSDLRSTRISRGVAGSALLLLALTASCNVHGLEAPSLPSELPGHILIISGMGRTDTTTNVKLDFPFVVQLGGSSPGNVAGHTVKFTSLVGNTFEGPSFLLMAMTGSQNYISESSDIANDLGRATVQVRLAPVDGNARVEVAVRELGLADTVYFTIAPAPR